MLLTIAASTCVLLLHVPSGESWQHGNVALRHHPIARRLQSSAASSDDAATTTAPPPPAGRECDVVVIGSGIGGLSAGALLSSCYGKEVVVCEAHEHPGGVAHGFERRTKDGAFLFDSGPSLWAGMSTPSTNPLRQVLDATGQAESVDWVGYSGWGLHYAKEGYGFRFDVGPKEFEAVVAKHAGGAAAVEEWRALLKRVEPIITAAMGTPPMALRGDLAAAATAVPYTLGSVIAASLEAKAWVPQYLTGPFSDLMGDVSSKWTRDWLDYLSFALSGLDATGTIAAAVVYTLGDLHRSGAYLDYPIGGSESVINALVRGVEEGSSKKSELRLRTPVEEILLEEGRAVGVRLRSGETIRARLGVISNAPVWDTLRLLPPKTTPSTDGASSSSSSSTSSSSALFPFMDALPAAALSASPLSSEAKIAEWRAAREAMPATDSFTHLHLGIDGAGIPADLDCHHSVLLDWGTGITARENMYIVSIPSLFDPTLAPPGKHVVHIYAAANEPFAAWEGMDRKSKEYAEAKAAAMAPLWQALELIIPDIRERTEVSLDATPLTHERFTRRYKGTYGPSGGKEEGDLDFLGPSTPFAPNLKLCGDSCFPGIGVPSVAASGIIAAHTFVSLDEHRQVLDRMEADGTLCVGRGWWTDYASGKGKGGRGTATKNRSPPQMSNGGRISLLCDTDSPGEYTMTTTTTTAERAAVQATAADLAGAGAGAQV